MNKNIMYNVEEIKFKYFILRIGIRITYRMDLYPLTQMTPNTKKSVKLG